MLQSANPRTEKIDNWLERERPVGNLRWGIRDGIRYLKMGRADDGMQSVVRDWTQRVSDLEPEGWGRLRSAYEDVWIKNFIANRQRIVATIPPGRPGRSGPYAGKTCYLAGNGPCLKKNAHLLAGKAHVIGTNRINALWPAIRPEFYAAIDAGAAGGADPAWADEIGTHVRGVFSVFCNPKLTARFRRTWWFNVWGRGNDLWDLVDAHMPGIARLDSGYNVCYSALHMAYRLGFSKIVLVGMDHAFSGGYEYFTSEKPWIFRGRDGEWLFDRQTKARYDARGGLIRAVDIAGRDTWTDPTLVMAAEMLAGACFFIGRDVEIVNCTEGGIFSVVKCDRLENHV